MVAYFWKHPIFRSKLIRSTKPVKHTEQLEMRAESSAGLGGGLVVIHLSRSKPRASRTAEQPPSATRGDPPPYAPEETPARKSQQIPAQIRLI